MPPCSFYVTWSLAKAVCYDSTFSQMCFLKTVKTSILTSCQIERQTFLYQRNSNRFTDALGIFIFRTHLEASSVSLSTSSPRMKIFVVYMMMWFRPHFTFWDRSWWAFWMACLERACRFRPLNRVLLSGKNLCRRR